MISSLKACLLLSWIIETTSGNLGLRPGMVSALLLHGQSCRHELEYRKRLAARP